MQIVASWDSSHETSKHSEYKFQQTSYWNVFIIIFFQENRFGYFMQIVSDGDSLHEMSNPVFFDESKKKISSICPMLNLPRVVKVNCFQKINKQCNC